MNLPLCAIVTLFSTLILASPDAPPSMGNLKPRPPPPVLMYPGVEFYEKGYHSKCSEWSVEVNKGLNYLPVCKNWVPDSHEVNTYNIKSADVYGGLCVDWWIEFTGEEGMNLRPRCGKYKRIEPRDSQTSESEIATAAAGEEQGDDDDDEKGKGEEEGEKSSLVFDQREAKDRRRAEVWGARLETRRLVRERENVACSRLSAGASGLGSLFQVCQ